MVQALAMLCPHAARLLAWSILVTPRLKLAVQYVCVCRQRQGAGQSQHWESAAGTAACAKASRWVPRQVLHADRPICMAGSLMSEPHSGDCPQLGLHLWGWMALHNAVEPLHSACVGDLAKCKLGCVTNCVC